MSSYLSVSTEIAYWVLSIAPSCCQFYVDSVFLKLNLLRHCLLYQLLNLCYVFFFIYVRLGILRSGCQVYEFDMRLFWVLVFSVNVSVMVKETFA